MRDKETIVLPKSETSRFYSLRNGEQFLVTVGDLGSEGDRRLFFGGMDESPFLVELEIAAIEHLIHGEDAFYQALKPPCIRYAEEKMRATVRRQGDIFAAQPYKKLSDMLRHNTKKGTRASMWTVERASLFGTRHRFTGIYGTLEKDDRHMLVFGEGILEAPDHASLKLKGPHIFEQSLFLLRPEEAD